jgi:hypothetical protein
MKRKSWIIGGLMVVVLLAGAAFVGGRLLNQSELNGGLVPGSQAEGGKSPRVRLQVVRAGELPTSEPDAIGPFVERRDNSLFMAFGSKFQILTNKDGSVRTDGMDTGQRLEVVVTTETTVYEDTTKKEERLAKGVPPPADGNIQQEVAAGSLDRIGTNSVVWAWGERRGDRMIANVVLYTPAEVIFAPDHPDP